MPGSTPARVRTSSGRPVTPMSERQQMMLVRQMDTTPTGVSSPGSGKKGRECNGRGETRLHRAAIRGDADAVRRLLADGADPNAKDFAGWTALHEACNHGWLEVAEALLDAGANVNSRGLDDDTPLHDATANAHLDLARLLVERGAEMQAVNGRGKMPGDLAPPGMMPYLLHTLPIRAANAHPHSIENLALDKRKFGGKEFNGLSDMRRTRVEKSPRVTLKLHHIKKRSGKLNFDDLSNTCGPAKLCISMEDAKTSKEDVYEFKTGKEVTTPAPARSTSAEPQPEPPVSEPKVEGEVESESISLGKRVAVENETDDAEEEAKRRKKKEETSAAAPPGKDVKVPTTASRLAAVRGANAAAKASLSHPHTPSKTAAATAASAAAASRTAINSDRKSPTSPKGGAGPVASPGSAKGDGEGGEGDCDRLLGPKVPPLKIVIPPPEADNGGARNGKHNSSRHTALPYVVSSNSNDSEKDGSVSPTDPAMAMMTEEQKTLAHNQRVLRSHRGAEPPSRPCSAGSAPPTVASPPAAQLAAAPLPPATNSAGPSSSENSPGAKPESSLAGEPGGSPAAPTLTPSTTPPADAAPAQSSSGSTKGSNPPTPSSGSGSGGGDERCGETADPGTPSHTPTPADLHPRKRKLKHRSQDAAKGDGKPEAKSDGSASASSSDATDGPPTTQEATTHDQPVKNCYQLYLDIRKQVERRRQSLFPVQPKPPQGFKDYLINRGAYLLASNAANRQIPSSPLPQGLQPGLNDLFSKQERDRHRLRLQHIIEKEKLVLSVEQEILRVHGRAARALANQSVPFSVCTVLKDKEVYNLFTPEQEEKDRNARSRYNGRLFLGWLQDVDDKWEKIKEHMLLRHHNEAESLHAVQKMDWEWKMVEIGLCTLRTKLPVPPTHVPIVHVSDDFDLLPA